MATDDRERLAPAYGKIAVRSPIISHGMCQPADHLEIIVTPAGELGHRVIREELRRAALRSRLPRHGLRTLRAGPAIHPGLRVLRAWCARSPFGADCVAVLARARRGAGGRRGLHLAGACRDTDA